MKTFTTVSLAATLLTTLTSAQQQYQIDPNSVNITLRNNWCDNERAQCPLICSQVTNGNLGTVSNDCTPESLAYTCVCADGQSPNVTEYTQTLPFFVCQEWGNQCASNCGNDNTCVSACRQNHPCGAQSPIRANTSTLTSSTMSTTMSGSASGAAATVTGGETVYSGFAGASASQTSGGGAAAASSSAPASAGNRVIAMQFGQSAGFLALAAAFFGGFAFLL